MSVDASPAGLANVNRRQLHPAVKMTRTTVGPLDGHHMQPSATLTRSPVRKSPDDSVESETWSSVRSSPGDTGPSGLNLSFCGCGFLGLYHLGVASKFTQCGKRFLGSVDRYAGASAGSLIACLLGVIGPDPRMIDKCCVFSYHLADSIQEIWFGVLSPRSDMIQPLEALLYDLLPIDAHLVATGRLYLSVTHKQSARNVVVSTFDSNDHLVQCLLASCCIPRLTGRKSIKIHGKKYIDGGLSNNMPILTKGRTITVSPFSGRHDVCPQDPDSWPGMHVNLLRQDFQVNFNNVVRGVHSLVPPNRAQLRSYFRCGANDAERFLRRERFFEDDTYLKPERRQSI